MKTKKFNKLSLNKQTVASLNSKSLGAINGGSDGVGEEKTVNYNCFIIPQSKVCLIPKTFTIGGMRSAAFCSAGCPTTDLKTQIINELGNGTVIRWR